MPEETSDSDMTTRLQVGLLLHDEAHPPCAPVDLDWLNGLLAAYKQPLATMTEIRIWYGAAAPSSALN